MSTATDERVDLDVDLDAEVPCNMYRNCHRSAVWVDRCRACGYAWLACDPCRVRSDAEDDADVAEYGVNEWECSACEAPAEHPTPWRPL